MKRVTSTMKTIGLLFTTVVVVTILFAGLSFVAANDDPSDPPEFYFTRLAYSERPDGCCRHRGGFRFGFGQTTMPIPRQQFVCPEFGGGRFFPGQGWGWGTDYPGGDCKFMGGIHRLTGLRVNPNPNIIGVMDPALFKYPYLYAVEVGGMYFDDGDAARIREYLLRGGFLHVDDFWGLRERGNFETQMRKVFPEKQMEVLPLSHPIFHTFFDIGEIMQIPNQGSGCFGGPTWEVPDETQPRVYGMSDDNGRLMVVATYNADYGDAWEYMDLPCYPERYSGQAYRFGLNVMIYAMSH
jgi:hypothetical protein